MEEFKISNMYNLDETIAADYMKTKEYPWELLSGIKDYILELGKTLPADKFEKRGEDVWIAKSAKTLVTVKNGADDKVETGLKKMGAMLADNVEVGCNSVLNPGTVIGRNCNVYPLSSVRGCIPEGHIFKDKDHIVKKTN